MNRYIINEKNVKLTGRGTYDEDGIYWCALSGSGFECHFTGSYLAITLVGDGAAEIPDNDLNWARYAIYVNGIRVMEGLLNNFTTVRKIEVIKAPQGVTVGADIKFIKLSECAMSTVGICPIECEGEVAPIPAKPLKLEFIGDSITCGYGVDEYDANSKFRTATEDFTKGYAYKTGKLLDADVRAFSISGWGIISGYTEDETPHDDQLLPPYYEKLGYSFQKFDDRDGWQPQDCSWDFTKYVPDLIIVNLGTNDASYCKDNDERKALYTEKYAEFLGDVHRCNPSSKLLCVLGIMDDRCCDAMEKAVRIFSEKSGFTDIHTMRFTPHDGSLGYGADWHPSPATHDKSAKLLAEKIQKIMK